jgi:hypothetical protein
MTLLASTGAAGYTLVNGTGNLFAPWTAPNDGLLHRLVVIAVKHVTSGETGGVIAITTVIPDGTSSQKTLLSGTQAAGVFWPINASYSQQQLLQANAAVTVTQTSALTAGASVAWVELWGS